MAFSAQQSVSGTLVASTQQTFTFGYAGNNTPIRYAYVLIENTGAGTIFARTDGQAATVNGDFCTAVPAGTTIVMANAAPWWSQAASVIPASNAGAAAYTGAEFGTNPPEVNPMGTSPYGQLVSPGTTVSVISAGTPTFTITGTG